MGNPPTSGPYYATKFTTPIGNGLNGNIGNDLTYVFSTIKIIYAYGNYNVGGGVEAGAVTGQGGMFVLVVNKLGSSITVGAGGIINGKGNYTFNLSKYSAQLLICCGQVTTDNISWFTSWITIGNQQACDSDSSDVPPSSGPYYPISFVTPIGNGLNGNIGNDLTYVFSTIKIIYTYDDYVLGDNKTGGARIGQGGMFVLVVNQGTDSLNVIPGGYLNGSGSTQIGISGLCSRLFICCGQMGGYTSWITIGDQQYCDSETSDVPASPGPYYATNFVTPIGNSLNNNIGNDLTYVFSTIKIIYTYDDYAIGGKVSSGVAYGQGGNVCTCCKSRYRHTKC